MKYRKVLNAAGIALASALLLAGCGQKTEPAKENEKVTEAAEQPEEAAGQTAEDQQSAEPQQEETAGSKEAADKAPDFELTLLSGETVKLSDYEGKKVLINFWATWCGPCVREMPAFEKLHNEFSDKLVILGVNSGESADTVQRFADKNGFTFPIGLDETYEIQSLYPGVMNGIPYTVIVDEERNIIHTQTGAGDADQMYDYYKSFLD